MLPAIPCHPYAVLGQEWIFTVIACIFVCLRVYVRIRRRMFSPSDAVLVMAMVSLIFSTVCDTILVLLGFSDQELLIIPDDIPESIWNAIPRDRLIPLLKTLWASSFPYYTTLWLVKLALLLLYYQLLTPEIRAPRLRIYLHLTTFIVVLTYLVIIPLNVVGCIPIQLNWEVDNPQAACIEYNDLKIYYTTACLHVITEILVFSIPFPLLPHLRLARRTRKAIAGMFMFGFFGVAVTLSRMIYVLCTTGNPVIGILQSWACLEQAVGIVVCCLPAIWTLRLGLKGDGGDVERLYVSREVIEDTFRRKKVENGQVNELEAADEKWWWELRAQRNRDTC